MYRFVSIRVLAFGIICMALQAKAQYWQRGMSKEAPDTNTSSRSKGVGFSLANSYVSASVGLGLPMYGMASNSSQDWSGYARLGLNLNVFGGITVYDDIGVAAMIGYNRNRYDVNAFLSKSSAANGINYSMPAAKPYVQTDLLAGFFYALPLIDKFSMDFRALAGIVIMNYPNPSWAGTDTNGTTFYSINTFQSQSFAIDVGGDLKYLLGPRFYAVAGADLLFANTPYFGQLRETNSAGTIVQPTAGRMEVTMLIGEIGLGYKLWK